MALSNEQFNQEHAMLLREKHTETIKNIRELQEIEKFMFQNLERLTGQDGQSQQENEILQKINELSAMRIGLFNDLKDAYTTNQNDLHSARNQLADQMTTVGVVENELNRLKENIDALHQEKTNKVRMVQIGNYESSKYDAHKSVMQVVVISSLIILAASILLQQGILPPMIASSIVVITISIGLIYIGRQVVDIMSRNNMDYSKYDFSFDPAQMKPGYESVYDHDKKFFSKLGGDFRADFNSAKDQISGVVGGLSKTVGSMESDISSLTANTLNKPNETVKMPGSPNEVQGEVSKTIENFASY